MLGQLNTGWCTPGCTPPRKPERTGGNGTPISRSGRRFGRDERGVPTVQLPPRARWWPRVRPGPSRIPGSGGLARVQHPLRAGLDLGATLRHHSHKSGSLPQAWSFPSPSTSPHRQTRACRRAMRGFPACKSLTILSWRRATYTWPRCRIHGRCRDRRIRAAKPVGVRTENTRSHWASLCPNDDDPDGAPLLSVGWSGPLLPRPECVVVALCQGMRIDPLTAVRALGLLRPDIQVRPRAEIEARMSDLGRPADPCTAGLRNGLGWLAGTAEQGPASGWPCHPNVDPSPQHVHAELLFTSGLIFLGRGEPRLHGVDEALGWATNISG